MARLIELVKQAIINNAKKDAPTEGVTDVQPVTTKTFKLHADQKQTVEEALTKAKSVASTTVDSVAFELICLDYIGGTGKSATVAGQLQKLGLDEALKAFEEAFPDVALSAELPDTAEAA